MHIVFGTVLVASGCYGTATYSTGRVSGYSASIDIPAAPPEPIVETPPPAPYPGAAWTAGYWDWRPDARQYVWAEGRWVMPPSAGVVFMPPRWERGRVGWRRAPGRWVPGESQDRFGRRVWFDALGRPHYL